MGKKQLNEQEKQQLFVPELAIIEGNMSLSGDVRIEGRVNGNVTSSDGNLIFGPKSQVTGNVTGSDIATGGIINGDIFASEQLSVFSGAEIRGKVEAAAILVEKGAVLRGPVFIGCACETAKDSISQPESKAPEPDSPPADSQKQKRKALKKIG